MLLKKRSKIGLFVVSVLNLTIIACAPGPYFVRTEDVSKEVKLWYGYKKLGTYVLKEDVFIRIIDLPLPNKHILVAPREKTKGIFTLHFSSPFSISEYENNRDKWDDIKGIVKAGTRLQCTKLIRYKPLGFSDSLYLYAKIINGPHAGMEVEIGELSLLGPESDAGYLHKPNPNLLTPIEKDKKTIGLHLHF
jgi:hypothetical protein